MAGGLTTLICPTSGKEILVIDPSSRFLTEFVERELLGSGGFGVVTSCISKVDDFVYAIKKIPLYEDEDPADHSTLISYDTLIREVRTHAKLDHSNVIRYHSAWVEDSLKGKSGDGTEDGDYRKYSKFPCIYAQLQLCAKTLEQLIRSTAYPRTCTRELFEQMLDGLAYLHKQKIVHGDLSPDNIFLDKEVKVKIGDFGLAGLIGAAREKYVGEKLYQPPGEQKTMDTKYDMYSIGVILFEWLSELNTDMEKAKILDNLLRKGAENMEEELKKLDANQKTKEVLKDLLDGNPLKRPSASELKGYLISMFPDPPQHVG